MSKWMAYGPVLLATLAWSLSGHDDDWAILLRGALYALCSLGLAGFVDWKGER